MKSLKTGIGTILTIVIIVVTLKAAYSSSITTWSDGVSEGNISFIEPSNITKYVDLPTKSIIYESRIDLVFSNSTGRCYQENATESNSCLGDLTGSYVVDAGAITAKDLIYDGDWSTYGSASAPNTIFRITYDKPQGVLSTSKWKVKHYNGTVQLGGSGVSWNNCFAQSPLQLRIVFQSGPTAVFQCFAGGSQWNTLTSVYGYPIYEEAMNWSVYTEPKNFSLDIGADGSVDYFNNSLLDGFSINNLSLNTSHIASYLATNGSPVPISFGLLSPGLISFSNIFINYSVNNSANIFFLNSTAWIFSMYSDESVTREFTINNTGDHNASNCSCSLSGSLNNFYSPTYFNVSNGSATKINVTISSPSAILYTSNYLDCSCSNADSFGNVIHTPNDVELLFSVSTRPAPTTGGGSGSSQTTTVIVNSNESVIIDFGVLLSDFLVLNPDKEQSRVHRITNRGSKNLESASLVIEGSIGNFLVAEVCDLGQSDCRTDDISIAAGESKLLVIDGVFGDDLGEGAEGIIKLVADDGKVYGLDVTISRAPGYRQVDWIADQFGVSQTVAGLIGIGIAGLGVVVVVNIARML